MKLSVLPSVTILVALTSTSTTAAQNATSPGDPTGKTPGIFAQARSAFTGEKMFLGEAKFSFENETQLLRTIFWSLDFSQPWRTDAPAWTKLVYQPGLTNDTARPLAVNKNGSAVYCFDTSQAIKYNTSQAEWEKPFNLTLPFNTMGDAIADTDQDNFFHLNQNLTAATNALQLVLFNPQNDSAQVVSSDMGQLVNTTTLTPGAAFPKGVYSSASKSLYFANMDGPNAKQYQFNVANQAWTSLTEKGDIPQARSGQCYVSAAGGTKIIMAGGLQTSSSTSPPGTVTASPTPTTTPGGTPPTNYNDVLSDVYVFTVASSTWAKVANTPVGFYGATCAVNGDYLIFYGGYNQYSSVPLRMVYNANTPYILNLQSNTWVTDFVPAKVGGPAPSGASGKKATGLVGVVVSVLAAGLTLL
ncbi:hypothetical protein BGZ52_006766 [Haplosporangium bisporale]|nr:hypothetical protein BGZ52_006766 [Haplosporangium bisporale]